MRTRLVRGLLCSFLLLPCASLALAPDCPPAFADSRHQLRTRLAVCPGSPSNPGASKSLMTSKIGERYSFGQQGCVEGGASCSESF
jgi:hypothetical protein